MINPLVTIIIPTYRHEKYIENCLDSLINQTYRNIELIILNDGSPDDTDAIINKYEKNLKDRFINYIYINKGNEGICKTLNRGLEIATGKYIILFASDDVMYPKRVEKQVGYMEKNPKYGMIYADGYNIKSDDYIYTNSVFDPSLKFSKSMNFLEGDLSDFMLENVFLMPTPTMCVKKDVYDVVGTYDENIMCEDVDMFIRISRSFEIGCIKEPLVVHRIHNNNSGKSKEIIIPSINTIIEKYKKSHILIESEKNILLFTLNKTMSLFRGTFNKELAKGRKLIIWGTGGAYKKYINYNKDILHEQDIVFLIDSDMEKVGKIIDGRRVYGPDKLLEVDKSDYYILVLSVFYREIYKSLNNYGIEFVRNYY